MMRSLIMTTWQYIAKDLTGDKITGTLEADSEAAALRDLNEAKLYPIKILQREEKKARATRVSNRQVGVFYQQLADLLRAGSPLLSSMEVLSKATANKKFSEIIIQTRDDVAAGKSLSEAMAEHPGVFQPLHVAMLTAGERGGFIEQVLESTAVFIERIDDLKSKVVGAMVYPAILMIVGIGVVTGLLIGMVPMFRTMFEGMPMPLPTQVIFAASSLLTDYWPAMIGVVVLLGIVTMIALRDPRLLRLFDRIRLRLPLAGTAMRMVAITRFCRILGTMLKNGVPLLESLDIAAGASGSVVMKEMILAARENVSRGGRLCDTLRQANLIPLEVVEMIAVAEESNQMEKTLLGIADTVEARTNRKVDLTIRLIEPLMLILLASAIGFIAFGILYPVLTMAMNIKG